MAAICTNHLTIWSDEPAVLDRVCEASAPPPVTRLQRLAAKAGLRSVPRKETGLFQFLNPMPANIDELHAEAVPQLSDRPKSYFWRLENWGCQRDISYEFQRTGNAEIRVEFPTEYSAPASALQHGAKLHGFRFRLLFCEPGNGYCGIATESDHTEYEVTFERPPTDEGVPAELIATFRLNDIYGEYQADPL